MRTPRPAPPALGRVSYGAPWKVSPKYCSQCFSYYRASCISTGADFCSFGRKSGLSPVRAPRRPAWAEPELRPQSSVIARAASNSSAPEVETGGLLRVRGQPGLHL